MARWQDGAAGGEQSESVLNTTYSPLSASPWWKNSSPLKWISSLSKAGGYLDLNMSTTEVLYALHSFCIGEMEFFLYI